MPWTGAALIALGAIALAGCTVEDQPSNLAAQPRGATVAFESIDGPPPDQFRQLVQDLNEEAQIRRLAVMSREGTSAYRVRGYLAAKVAHRETTISWVWDVFDKDDRRALRVTGEETVKGKHKDAWEVADDAMLHRIAGDSMDQLATFLTSPEVAPSSPNVASVPQLVLAGFRDFTPEAAGIFRMFRPHADPAPGEAGEPPDLESAGPVPLPRSRPPADAVISARQTPTRTAAAD
ncbi:MAG: hypothetical protein ACREB8_04015 [Pseudolabrys sp.]